MTQILKLFSDRRGGTFSGMAPRTRTLRAGLFKPWVRRKIIWKKSIHFTLTMITVVVVGMLECVKILIAKKNNFSPSSWSQWLLGWCYGGRLISGPRRSQYPGVTGDHQQNTNKPKVGPNRCARCALLSLSLSNLSLNSSIKEASPFLHQCVFIIIWRCLVIHITYTIFLAPQVL